jgi:hypothetical protein
MKLNPYESPALETVPVEPAPKVHPILRWVAIILIAEPCLLLLAAALHRLQLDLDHRSDSYRTSPLIAVELIGLLLAFSIFLLASVLAFIFAISLRGRLTLIFGGIAILALLAALLAGWIDSPTLIYAT